MSERLRIGLLLGDRNGIGPELAARLLSQPDACERARVVVIGDPAVFRAGQAVAGVEVAADEVRDVAEARFEGGRPALLAFTDHACATTVGRVRAEVECPPEAGRGSGRDQAALRALSSSNRTGLK